MHLHYLSAVVLAGFACAHPLAARDAHGTEESIMSSSAQSPTPTKSANACKGTGSGGSGVNMAAAIAAIMPSSTSCDKVDFPDECRTAEQAAPFIEKACADLKPAECAATIALMGLESADLKYKHNVVPGTPGQGTANMMMAEFIAEYATDLFGADKVQGKSPDEVLALVTPDEYNFGSAAWFLKNKCSADVRSSLQTGTDEGWLAYNECIRVNGANVERMAYWTRAKAAFNL
ncbi:hypothetical protein VTJ49DRAFT_6980 [Mycothermus thermophilus]|uniref:Uncharacterized protein n=1 Tax=Humicola insolens TaxID=85995 RepID=A0ABR3VI75_HUMIN